MLAEPGHYDYAPYTGRPKIVWPGGARIAVWLAPNIEHYELEPPNNPRKVPWPRPVPDILNYAHRDYGNRAGFWRMADTMAKYGVRGIPTIMMFKGGEVSAMKVGALPKSKLYEWVDDSL